jgi:hypothetical protein
LTRTNCRTTAVWLSVIPRFSPRETVWVSPLSATATQSGSVESVFADTSTRPPFTFAVRTTSAREAPRRSARACSARRLLPTNAVSPSMIICGVYISFPYASWRAVKRGLENGSAQPS